MSYFDDMGHCLIRRPILLLPPHHLIHYPHIALDDLHHLRGDILIHIVKHWKAMVAILTKRNGGIYRLEQRCCINTGNDKIALVYGLGTFRGGSDTDRRERMAYTREEAALLRKCSAVTDNCKGIHLQTIVVMKAQWLMLHDTAIQLES